jgi:hypothetical protein
MPSQPPSVLLLARGISLLSITQLRELLREYSLPTGGNKTCLVNRLVIFLETFSPTQQNLLGQFSTKLKSLLSIDPDDSTSPSSTNHPEDVSKSLTFSGMTHRLPTVSPTCLFENTNAPIPFGPVLIHIPQMLGYQHRFALPLPPGDFVPILQFTSVSPRILIRKLSIQLSGVFITFLDNIMWTNVSEFVNRQGLVQILQIDPPVPIIAFIRWMEKVSLVNLTEKILTKKEFIVQYGHSRTRPNGVCPLTRKLIARPARGVKCQHDDCFDLTGFLSYAMRTNSWTCPICHIPLIAEDLRVDPNYFKIAIGGT